MLTTLTQAVRATTGLTYTATVVGLIWVLGIDTQPAPHTGVLVCLWVATGAITARAALLWIRQVYGRRRARRGSSGVRLTKEPDDAVATWDALYRVPDASEGWSRARQLLANAALVAAAMTAVTLPFLPGRDSLVAAIQRADAEVMTATVSERPQVVKKVHDDDDNEKVVGYYSKLRVSVPGATGPLSVGPVRSDKPFEVGARLPVMWSPSHPGLGAYTNSPTELKRLAQGSWVVDLTSSGASGPGAMGLAFVFGLCMLPCVTLFAVGFDPDTLHGLAWSPIRQTVHALVLLGAAYAYTPALMGLPHGGLVGLCQLGGWLPIAGLVLTPIWGKDR
ncbi:hypothetical protein ACFYM2_08790 [Streptomyces sp. NPDC006711]|uniref:hypothetical protein n=1 Tax=Streptomyces sp. NPDC006711 TaxID=3364762 RepID=UPI00367A464E